ncbi:MAG: glycosyltransferase family 39 protein [Verrucomicrobiales bacterium]|nr:glycosyltransferase family 39 protein [Verrucomicrobiales bacterium]
MSSPSPAVPVLAAPRDPRSERRALAILLLLGTLFFVLRWAGPSNLTDNDQERPASYVLDAVVNHHWLAQQDWTGDLTSKPPLYTWLAATFSTIAGRVSLFTLYLPCGLAIVGTAWLTARETTRIAGWRSGFLAGWFVLVNPLSAKLIALARTDAVFTFTVSLTAMLAFRAWTHPNSPWIRAWIAATAATLTKGPLGIWMGFCGLAAAYAKREPRAARPALLPQLAGLALLLAVAGGWFLLAWQSTGDALVNKMLKAELVQHAVRRDNTLPGAGLLLVPAYFLGRFAPWSVLAVAGAWLAWRTPGPLTEASRFRRFCAAWIAGGILVLGLASHQRGDLVSPLVLPGAVLAASVAEPWFRRGSDRKFLVGLAVLGVVAALGLQIQHQQRRLDTFASSAGCAQLARTYLAQGGQPARLLHLDTPYALQFHLQTMERAVTGAEAATRLVADPTLHVALSDRSLLEPHLAAALGTLHTVARWPAGTGTPRLEILQFQPVPARAP